MPGRMRPLMGNMMGGRPSPYDRNDRFGSGGGMGGMGMGGGGGGGGMGYGRGRGRGNVKGLCKSLSCILYCVVVLCFGEWYAVCRVWKFQPSENMILPENVSFR